MNTTSPLIQVCVFLFIALSPIQDFFLQGTPLRSLGASPSLFPLVVIAVVTISQWLISGCLKIHRLLLISLAYVFATTIYGFLYFGFTSHGENLIWKSITSFISLAFVIFAVTNIDYRISLPIRTGIHAAFALVILGFCFTNANPFGLPSLLEIPILHYSVIPQNQYLRPRGLSSEPSEFSVSAIVFGLLCAHITRSQLIKRILVGLTFGLLIASGSKGGILTLLLCAFILWFMKWHSRWYHVAGLLLVLPPLGLALFLALIPKLFPEDIIALSGTIPTRFSMILCACITVMHHPLGVGLSGFLPTVAAYLPSAMSTVQSFFTIPLNFDEVSQYQISADMVSTKTFFFDQLIRFGIPFAVCFLFFITKTLNRLVVRRQWVLAVATLASAIAVTTYIPTGGVYTIAIMFGIALSEVRIGSNTCSSK